MGLLDLFEGGLAQPPSLGLAPPSAPPPPPADPYSRFDSIYDEVSKETGIPAAILKAQTMQESSFNPDVVSKTGGVGLMQIQPSTAAQPGYGVEPLDPSKLTDPAENIRFGARYLAARAKSEGVQNWNDPQQVAKALAAYNGGGDPNYVQNVFRHLKPPGGAQPQAGEPASAKPQAQDGNWVAYANQSAIRNKPLQPELVSAMSFLPQMGITMRVNSGGQEGIGEGKRRTGSTRHDHGGAGDVQFLRNGKPLSWENPNDIPVLQQIVRQARQNGVTGIGAGPGYMNPTTTHIGFGKPAIWGAKGGSPYAALAEAVGNTPVGNRPLNPTITAAAERGRGPAADRPAHGAAVTGGQRAMPPMMAPDLSNANDAGVRDFIMRESGMAPDQSGSAGFTIPGASQTTGGLGGLGGIPVAPASRPAAAGTGGGFDFGDVLQAVGMSLMTSGRKNPLENFPKLFTALNAASQERHKTAQEQAALATALVSSGMAPEQAKLYAVNPTAAQIALKQVTEAKTRQQEAEFNTRLNGGPQPSAGQPAQIPGMPGPAPAAPDGRAGTAGPAGNSRPSPEQPYREQYAGAREPQPTTPAAAPSHADIPARFDTGNKTTDALFNRRAAKVRDYEAMARNLGAAPTDRAKSAVEGRLKAIEKEIGQIDKQIETYAPEESKRAAIARGALPEEVASLRKEVQGLPSYKNVAQAAPVYKSMLDAAGRDNRASDVNLIYGMAKLMDPGSVVRESEMTVAQAIATLPQQIQQNIKSQLGQTGRLSKDVREGIMREAYSRMSSYNALFAQDSEQYRGIATRRKMDLADVIPSFGEFKPYEPPEAKAKSGANGSTAPGNAAMRTVPEQYIRPDGSSPPMPSAAPPRKALTKADWEKLAPGELYIDARGDTRRKGGN